MCGFDDTIVDLTKHGINFHEIVLDCKTLANSTFTFLLLSAQSYRKFPAEQGNNVVFSVGAFVHKKLGILCFSYFKAYVLTYCSIYLFLYVAFSFFEALSMKNIIK